MSDCRSIDPLITPYVDGDIDAAGRLRVDAHVRACPPCHSRVASERAVRELMRVKRPEIAADTAPAALHARCAALRARDGMASLPSRLSSAWRSRLTPISIAAGVILVLGGVWLYDATDRSTRVLAAELTADHVKCFGVVNPIVGTNADTATIERAMEETFGWNMHVPQAAAIGLELVGARPCLYAKGRAAHLMYRHHGQPVSVFMLPQLARAGKQNEMVDVMGHEAAVWSEGGRTFVLVAREPEPEVQRVVSAVQAGLR